MHTLVNMFDGHPVEGHIIVALCLSVCLSSFSMPAPNSWTECSVSLSSSCRLGLWSLQSWGPLEFRPSNNTDNNTLFAKLHNVNIKDESEIRCWSSCFLKDVPVFNFSAIWLQHLLSKQWHVLMHWSMGNEDGGYNTVFYINNYIAVSLIGCSFIVTSVMALVWHLVITLLVPAHLTAWKDSPKWRMCPVER